MGFRGQTHRSPLLIHIKSLVQRQKRLNVPEASGNLGLVSFPGHSPYTSQEASEASGRGGPGDRGLLWAKLGSVGREEWYVRQGLGQRGT